MEYARTLLYRVHATNFVLVLYNIKKFFLKKSTLFDSDQRIDHSYYNVWMYG